MVKNMTLIWLGWVESGVGLRDLIYDMTIDSVLATTVCSVPHAAQEPDTVVGGHTPAHHLCILKTHRLYTLLTCYMMCKATTPQRQFSDTIFGRVHCAGARR